MIEIERHIEILLLSNDCVIVPEFGGFVAHHVSSHYDERDNVFLPPKRTIGFNPQLTMNDSLLAQSYAEANNISYPQAVRCIQSDVRQLKDVLAQYGEYEIHGIGRLFINEEGKTAFTPIEAGILSPSFYGLGGFEIKELGTQYGKKARIVALTTDEISGQQMVSVSVKALRNVAVAAIIIAAFFIVASPFHSNPTLFSTAKVQSSIFSDVLSHDNNTKFPMLDATTAATQQPAKVEKKKKEKADSSAEQWVIVLCSHVGEKNAKRFTEELSKENITARVESVDGDAKVVYGNFPTKEKAQEALSAMKDNKHFAQGWLLQTK